VLYRLPEVRCKTCGGLSGVSSVDPRLKDAAFSLREAAKQLILLEDHLHHAGKRCPDCIHKHQLAAEAFAEEAVTLRGASSFPWAGGLADRVRGLRSASDARLLRKDITARLRDRGLGGGNGMRRLGRMRPRALAGPQLRSGSLGQAELVIQGLQTAIQAGTAAWTGYVQYEGMQAAEEQRRQQRHELEAMQQQLAQRQQELDIAEQMARQQTGTTGVVSQLTESGVGKIAIYGGLGLLALVLLKR